MDIKRILIVFFLSFTFLSSMDKYIPKNRNEREYLKNLREKNLVLGIKENYFADEKIEDTSLNDIIREMLKEYLQLNVTEKKGNWDKIYGEFQENNVDIINFLTKTNNREKFASFSNKVLEENLVIVSKEKKLNNFEDLNNLKIYVTRNTIYENFLKRFEKRNDLNFEIVDVKDVNLENLDYFADTSLNTMGEPNNLLVGRLPDASIGVRKEYEELIPILNRALEEKYSEKIEDWLKKRKNLLFKKNFQNSLTDDEKEYLKNLGPLKIGYADIEKMSTFSFKYNKNIGILPDLLSCLFKKIDIQLLEENNGRKKEWIEIYESFKNKKIDILTLSKTSEREKEFIFTKRIYNLNVYEIHSIRNMSRFRKIGVIKNSIEESIAREHYLEKNIKSYFNKEYMISDLKNNKLSSIVSLNSDIYDRTKFDIRILETVPINLALNKENSMLRDILNKAILQIVDLKELSKKSELNIRKEMLYQQEKNKSLIGIISFSCLMFMLVTAYQSLKTQKHKKKTEELLQDELTGLYSRRVYNEFCKNNNKLEGCTLLLDLNNFKNVNDTYGHDCGDEILIEVAKYLKDVFKDDYIFRISGDEFYMFSLSSNNIELKLMKLKRIFKESDLMDKYKISFSLGYYYKKNSISMRNAFKYADMVMYKAKKEKKEWYQEATESFINQNDNKI